MSASIFEVGERVYVDMEKYTGGKPYEITTKKGKTLSFNFAVGTTLEGIVRDMSEAEMKVEMRVEPLVGEILNVPRSIVSKK